MFESFLDQSTAGRRALALPFGYLTVAGVLLGLVAWAGQVVGRIWLQDREPAFIDFERMLACYLGSVASVALVAIGGGLVAIDLVLLTARRVRRRDP